MCVAGFGGSLPAYLRNGRKFWDSKLSMIQSNILVYVYTYTGFPYKTTEEYEKVLEDITDGLFEQDILQDGDALILMTHIGPNDSG